MKKAVAAYYKVVREVKNSEVKNHRYKIDKTDPRIKEAQKNLLTAFDDHHSDSTKGMRWEMYMTLIKKHYQIELNPFFVKSWSRSIKNNNRRARKVAA